MNIKNIICPSCGRAFFPSSSRKDIFQNSFDFDEELNDINFNRNLNNCFDFGIDSKYKSYSQEARKNFNNSVFNYKMNNFNFSIISAKNLCNYKKNQILEKKKLNNNEVKSSKKLGRKTKRDTETTIGDDIVNDNKKIKVHDKFSDDNMRKKCKNILLKSLLTFINNKIKILYKNNIGFGDSEKSLKVLKQKENKKDTISFDREFLHKNLKIIFSKEISGSYRNYSSDHNKIIINSLINEKDEEKRNYFNKLFEIKFIDCLKYFRGDKDIKELEGFRLLPIIKDELTKKSGDKYANHFVYYIENFEKLINRKIKKKKKI